jgi:hypothetical protein
MGSRMGQIVGLYTNTTQLGFGFLFWYYYLGVQLKLISVILVNEDRWSIIIPVKTI